MRHQIGNQKGFPVKNSCYYLGSVRVNFPKLHLNKISKICLPIIARNVFSLEGAIAHASPIAAQCLVVN